MDQASQEISVSAKRKPAVPPPAGDAPWTFLSNHTHVLLCLVRWPGVRMRDVALAVGISERAVQRIVADLEANGYLLRRKSGRQNVYELHLDRTLRHPLERHCEVGSLLKALLAGNLLPQEPPRPTLTWQA
jgi:hypothetical protein